MLTRTIPIGLLIVLVLVSVIGCADNPAGPDGSLSAAPSVNAEGPITEAQAIQIALAEVPGEVVETEREVENDIDMYGIEIKGADGKVKEVEIEVATGKVLNIEDDDDGLFDWF